MLKQDSSTYRGFRTAGIRLREELVPSLVSHRSDKIKDQLYTIHMFDKAHITMLTEKGFIPREDGRRLLIELRRMDEEGTSDEIRLTHGGGMHSGEQYLIRVLGEEVGGRMHLGRSSGDLGEVSTRIYVRDGLLQVMESILRFRETLIDIGEKHAATIMPGYTHAQHAQPTTYGHMILSWASVLERDMDRLRLCFTHMNRSPAGAAILTGSDFELDRHRVGALLGFDGVEKNTFDAILCHDNLFETASTLATLHMNLGRWCEDLMLYNTSEFGMIDFPDRFCGTSSIMMQKKNAYAPQYVKGAAAESVGGLMTAYLVEKDPTSIPILDRAYSREAIGRSLRNIVRDIGWMNEFMPELDLRTDLMKERAGMFWAQATDVAGALVREKGMNWRSAHQIVGILVRLCEERGIAPLETTVELLDEAAMLYHEKPAGLDEKVLRTALDPTLAVHRRTLYGGPAPSEVAARLEEYRSILAADRARFEAQRKSVEDGRKLLEEAIDAIIAN